VEKEMINYMHTSAYAKLCWMDNDHQFHVKAYWDARHRATALIVDSKRTKQPAAKQSNNYIRNWYEQGYVSPTEARYPSVNEDPTAYFGE
jgi:hypothetical protein